MSSDGTQEKPFVAVWGGGNPREEIMQWAAEFQNKPHHVPTFEDILAAQYSLTPEQVKQLVETIRRASESWQHTFAEVWEVVRASLNQLRESPDFQALARQFGKTDATLEEFKQFLDLPKHKYERPTLPSQQGYNRTPYDRWRNSLGGGRRRR